jgi:cytochrome c553
MKTFIALLSTACLLAAAALLTAAAPPNSDLGFEDETPTHIVAVDIKKGMKKCRVCHGKDLGGKKKAPGIAGKSRKDILKALTTKIAKQMRAVVKGLDDEQKKAIASLISKMPKVEKKTPPPKAK